MASIFRSPRRQRRHFLIGLFWQLVRLGLFLGILVLVAVGAYQAGISQNAESVKRMRTSLEDARRDNTELVERAAIAEEGEKRLARQYSDLERRFDATVPKGELKALVDQVERKLNMGVEPDRLAFVIENAAIQAPCEEEVESQTVWVRTPTSTVTDNTAGFAEERIIVSSEGRSARSEEGLSEAWFDPTALLVVRFLLINGEVSSVRGELPLSHAVVLDGEEYRFNARPSDENGKLAVTMQICAFP